MNHNLKTDRKPFWAVLSGAKRFEFRINDRDFKLGDQLTLKEIDDNKAYTGRQCKVQVTYILDKGYGLPDGYVIMSITNPEIGNV